MCVYGAVSAQCVEIFEKVMRGFFKAVDTTFLKWYWRKWEQRSCQFTQQGHLQGQMEDDEGV